MISLLSAVGKIVSLSTGYPVPYNTELSLYLTAISLLLPRLPILSRHIAAFGNRALGRPAQPSRSPQDLDRLESLVNRYVDRALGKSPEAGRPSGSDQDLDLLEVLVKVLVERKMRERQVRAASACAVAVGNEADVKRGGRGRHGGSDSLQGPHNPAPLKGVSVV